MEAIIIIILVIALAFLIVACYSTRLLRNKPARMGGGDTHSYLQGVKLPEQFTPRYDMYLTRAVIRRVPDYATFNTWAKPTIMVNDLTPRMLPEDISSIVAIGHTSRPLEEFCAVMQFLTREMASFLTNRTYKIVGAPALDMHVVEKYFPNIVATQSAPDFILNFTGAPVKSPARQLCQTSNVDSADAAYIPAFCDNYLAVPWVVLGNAPFDAETAREKLFAYNIGRRNYGRNGVPTRGFDHCGDCAILLDTLNTYRKKYRSGDIKDTDRAVIKQLEPKFFTRHALINKLRGMILSAAEWGRAARLFLTSDFTFDMIMPSKPSLARAYHDYKILSQIKTICSKTIYKYVGTILTTDLVSARNVRPYDLIFLKAYDTQETTLFGEIMRAMESEYAQDLNIKINKDTLSIDDLVVTRPECYAWMDIERYAIGYMMQYGNNSLIIDGHMCAAINEYKTNERVDKVVFVSLNPLDYIKCEVIDEAVCVMFDKLELSPRNLYLISSSGLVITLKIVMIEYMKKHKIRAVLYANTHLQSKFSTDTVDTKFSSDLTHYDYACGPLKKMLKVAYVNVPELFHQ